MRIYEFIPVVREGKFDECPDCINFHDEDTCAECDMGELFEEAVEPLEFNQRAA